jgi:hypothetical protein
MDTPDRKAMKAMMHEEFKAMINPKKFLSRTGSSRYQDRNTKTELNFTSFGIDKLVNVKYGWPTLDKALLENNARQEKSKKKVKLSDCPEDVQGYASKLFPEFLNAVNSIEALTAQYVDTHDSPMSNRAKPDCTHPVASCPYPSPALVRFLGELKKRRKMPQFTNEEKEQAVGYALQWLDAEPIRKHFIVYLTDLCWIQFFNVDQEGQVLESPVLDLQKKGQQWLAGLLTASDGAVGYPEEVHFVRFRNSPVRYERFLGKGSMGTVFEDSSHQVIKLFSSSDHAVAEFSNFKNLCGRIKALPKNVKREFKSTILRLIPPQNLVHISDDKTAIRYPWLGTKCQFNSQSFADLVDFVHLLDKCGLVYRDLRSSNLVSYEARLIPIDYGSICVKGALLPYHGTQSNASDRLLALLSQKKKKISVTPVDDLHSLIRCARELVAVDRDEFDYSMAEAKKDETLRTFWDKKLDGDWWQMLSKHADSCDYKALRNDFLKNVNL